MAGPLAVTLTLEELDEVRICAQVLCYPVGKLKIRISNYSSTKLRVLHCKVKLYEKNGFDDTIILVPGRSSYADSAPR
jgi:hypothetical protein